MRTEARKILGLIVSILSSATYATVTVAESPVSPQAPVTFAGFQWPSCFAPQTIDERKVYGWVASNVNEYDFSLWNMAGRHKLPSPSNALALDAVWNIFTDNVEYTPRVNISALQALVERRAPITLMTRLAPEVMWRECTKETVEFWPATGFACEVDWVLRQGYGLESCDGYLKLTPPRAGATPVGPGLFTQHGDKVLLTEQGLSLMLLEHTINPGSNQRYIVPAGFPELPGAPAAALGNATQKINTFILQAEAFKQLPGTRLAIVKSLGGAVLKGGVIAIPEIVAEGGTNYAVRCAGGTQTQAEGAGALVGTGVGGGLLVVAGGVAAGPALIIAAGGRSVYAVGEIGVHSARGMYGGGFTNYWSAFGQSFSTYDYWFGP